MAASGNRGRYFLRLKSKGVFIMAKTKTEKIASIQEQIAQLENQRKRLEQQQKEQERKDRTKRLCKRMGLFESMLPDTITLTDEQFKIFLEKTVTTEHSRRILDGLTAQTANITASQGAEPAAQGNAIAMTEAAGTAQGERA
jgi:hypothetical protein